LGSTHLFLAALVLTICVLLIKFSLRFPRLTGEASLLRARQAFHTRPTPRVGGLAIFTALIVAIAFVPSNMLDSYIKILVASTLLFTAGLFEDLGFGVSPKKRLIAGLISSMLLVLLLGFWLPRIGVSSLDGIMDYWVVGVPLTFMVTVGSANAFNLIDGANGLAALMAMIVAASLAAVSHLAGYESMVSTAMLIFACIFGGRFESILS
jgi:UDP-N-acetylmuramyl pentapeptide phosphotransferase/UDP-N-acetylglucosamine-1-phosphate transferase